MIAGGLAVALAVVVGGYMAIGGRRGGDVPVITADERPIRVKPDNPGGMQVAGVNNEIFSENGESSEAKLAAPAETPNPNALRTAPKPAAEAPRVVPVAPPAARPATPPQAAAPAPAARTATGEAPKPAAVPAPAARTAQAPVAPAPAAQPEKRAAGGKVSIQLAAVGTEQAAKNEWTSLAKKMPDLLGSRAPLIVRAERDGKVFWRVRTAGFADAAEARAFCDKVKAKGGACTVAEF